MGVAVLPDVPLPLTSASPVETLAVHGSSHGCRFARCSRGVCCTRQVQEAISSRPSQRGARASLAPTYSTGGPTKPRDGPDAQKTSAKVLLFARCWSSQCRELLGNRGREIAPRPYWASRLRPLGGTTPCFAQQHCLLHLKSCWSGIQQESPEEIDSCVAIVCCAEDGSTGTVEVLASRNVVANQVLLRLRRCAPATV